MTVDTLTRKITVLGDDIVTEFDLGFTVLEADDISVTLVEADDTETTLVLNVDYSVANLGFGDQATVTYPLSGSPLATGDSLRIERYTSLLQTLDLIAGRAFNAENVEQALDRLTLAIQDLQGLALAEALSDSIIIGQNVQPFSDKLLALASLVWANNKIIRLTDTDSVAAQDFTALAQTLAAISTTANFRSAIGLGALATAASVDTAELEDAAVTEAKLATALVPLSISQTPTSFLGSRSLGTSYQNTTGRPFELTVAVTQGSGPGHRIEYSSDDATWIPFGASGGSGSFSYTKIIPVDWYYRVVATVGTPTITYWVETR